jgi:signal transduction histidine kinase/ligand-binding sensor domain-containing protein
MGKPHGQERYEALRLAVAGSRTVQLSILLAGVLLAWGPEAWALNPALDVSQYAHTAWKIRDGFVKGIINSIAQTPDGYLWLGTEFGLLRFDGNRAVSWQPPQGQNLLSSDIRALLAARDGTLWIGTAKGLANWKDGKLTYYPELADLIIVRLLEDRQGTVWAGAYGVPAGRLCSVQKGGVQCYGGDGSLGPVVISLFEDGKGNLWAGVRDGLWRWNPGPPKFYPLPGEPDGILALTEDADGALLVGWNGGVYRIVDGKTEVYPVPGTKRGFRMLSQLRDRDGGLWIGTKNRGLLHVHRGRTDVFSLPDGLSGEWAHCLFEDREGTMWVATLGGLDRFRDFAVPTLSRKEGLSNSVVGSVLAAKDGHVWLGTTAGLNEWFNGKISVFGKRDGKLNGYAPSSLFQDSRGRIWAATFREFGYLENNQFVPISGLPGGNVHGIAEDNAGNLWIANKESGLFRLSQKNEIQKFSWASLERRDYAEALAIDPLQDGLWLGFPFGGVAYFADGRVRRSYTVADGLGEGWVGHLRLDADGTLWAATEGGLSRLKNERIATLTSKNGLPCDTVHWSLQDDAHSLWLYMACGLVRIPKDELDAWITATNKDKNAKKTIRATVFDISDGVRPHTSGGYFPPVAKSPDGRLWFLPFDGVSIVDPQHIPFNKVPPPVHIEQVTADRKTYDATFVANGDAKGHLRLPPLIRDLEIDYAALSLVAPGKILFRYKLEGLDTDWHEAGNRRQAFYINLPPRAYRFRVSACNNSGVWNETGAFLGFSVAPAYYQTTWFRLSCVAAFLAMLWVLYQLRLRQLAREFNAGLEARVNERTRIARELHDSLLQGVQGLMFRLQAVRDMLPGRAPAEAIEALDIALERGDKAIAEGRDTVSDLREPLMGDSDIGQALTALGKELVLQSGNGLVPCVRVLLEGKQRELNPMLRDEIYRIGREALRNAFLHARAQKIEAEITYSDSEFLLHVRDDGGGIDPEVANQGARAGHWGLPGMRERAKSFGGKVEVWSEHGAGTEIELSVPGAIAYGKSERRRRFWLWRKKIGESDGQQS